MSFNKWKYNVKNGAELLATFKVVKVAHNSVNALSKDVAPALEQVAPVAPGMGFATPAPMPTPIPVATELPKAPEVPIMDTAVPVVPVGPSLASAELPKAPEAVVAPFTPQESEPIGPVATTAQTEMETVAVPSLEPLNTPFGEMSNKGLTDDAGNSLLKPTDIKEEMHVDTPVPAPSLPQESQASSIDSIITKMIEAGMAPELGEIREAITALKSSIAEMRAKLDELEKQYEAVEGLNKAVMDSATRIDAAAKEPMQPAYTPTPQPTQQVVNAPFGPQPYVPGQQAQQLRAA